MRRSFGFCFVLMGIPSVAMGTERETGVGIAAGIAFHKVKVKRTEQVSVDVEELDEELQRKLKELEEKLESLEYPGLLREFMQTVLDSGMAFLKYKNAHNNSFRIVGVGLEMDGARSVQQMANMLQAQYDGWCKQRRQMIFKYHPDRQPDPEKKKEAEETFKRYMAALDLYKSKLEMPFREAVQTGSNQVHLDLRNFSDQDKSILAEYYGLRIRGVFDAGGRHAEEMAKREYYYILNKGVALVKKFSELVNGGYGLRMQMYSNLKAASANYAIMDDFIGDAQFDEAGYDGVHFQGMKDRMEQLWGHYFNEEEMLLGSHERYSAELKEKKAKRMADTAPKELKVSKRCAKPMIELEGFREYHRGKFVAGAKVTLGTTFGKVKYCNDAYVAVAPMLGVKVGQRLVLYGLGGFMFQRLVSPLVGVGIKFNLSDRFYARLEGNRWSNKKVRANVIKLGFGWRL